ncbi:MAG: hypothetical protein GY868_18855 [Deltaproteobacteria bacterium]|nr:hypothetical protein [Deltaproteobacteria bacterium]
MPYVLNNTTFQALFGEITDQEVDAIALPASPTLRMDAGISAKVKQKAGEQVEDEALGLTPAAPGCVYMTGGGNIKAKHIFHCVMINNDKSASPEDLQLCLHEVFAQARLHSIRSIAFPALGSTFPGLTPQSSAEIIIAEAHAAVEAGADFSHLLFVVCDRMIHSHFKRALKKKFR